ncbi:hypothetical protein OG851_42160 (plasmid) [Streptomyces sp. NBC_00161]|uniref:hypothetical protein n=1 Tax=Streptomyces sp. NBC_00161 TaxID=2975671 RepID=UPI002F907258
MAQLSSSVSPAPAAAEVLRERYTHRLPASLGELTGPSRGVVELPLHVAWSGLRAYDLDRPRQRMSLYRTVLAEGQREDLTALLDRDLLTEQWPVLRTLVSRHIRQVWEERFPQLTARTRTTSAA